MSAPIWLKDEPWLAKWLDWFLDRLDEREHSQRERPVTRRVKKSTLPALYDFNEDTQSRWQLLNWLANEHHVFLITPNKTLAPFQEPYENAQLRLNPDSEPLLRDWLNRPKQDPITLAWQKALHEHEHLFIDDGDALLAQRPAAIGLTPDETVRAFAQVSQYLTPDEDNGLTLREISARCFNGNSKFLDHRQDLLDKLYGTRAMAILSRPLLLTAWAPPDFERLLVVENQDSFLRLVEQPPPGYALLYSGGFRASAQRLTSPQTRFAFLPGSDSERFDALWLTDMLPAYFWGDLDFAGFGILKSLRQSLPNLHAWEPGYQPMQALLERGGGHRAEQAAKERQIDPIQTGCAHSDTLLLPSLRHHKRFVDQETVTLEHKALQHSDEA